MYTCTGVRVHRYCHFTTSTEVWGNSWLTCCTILNGNSKIILCHAFRNLWRIKWHTGLVCCVYYFQGSGRVSGILSLLFTHIVCTVIDSVCVIIVMGVCIVNVHVHVDILAKNYHSTDTITSTYILKRMVWMKLDYTI